MRFFFLALFIVLLPTPRLRAGEMDRAEAFAREAAERIEEKPNVRGDNDAWFFLVRELRHLSTGRFWEKPWEDVAVNRTDPIPSILEFRDMLEDRGKQLVMVPVPAKARIYPGKLSEEYTPDDPDPLAPFVEALKEEKVRVIDLDAVFRKKRKEGDETPCYCAQDAHYSPAAIEVVADLILAELGVKPVSGSEITQDAAEQLRIEGDQVAGSEWEGAVPAEEVSIRKVRSGGSVGVDPDPESPFLLLGDSHTLVFHQGRETGMHCRGGGLADQLSLRLGAAIDLVGVRGSGLVQARKQLFYRATAEAGFWERKQFVIWVFSEREFTQSFDRMVSIPLDREATNPARK
ncbi:MAG: hypothetical protein P1U68_14890 [Verrucomicrobiales bacterium]|nr:hypothetical protein [Verrucomicrobiales bacterium]